MATTVPNPKQSTPEVAGYHAAVVHDFGAPLSVEQVPWRHLEPGPDPGQGGGIGAVPHRHPRRPRRLAGQALAAVHPRP